jgi:hypothetical protein
MTSDFYKVVSRFSVSEPWSSSCNTIRSDQRGCSCGYLAADKGLMARLWLIRALLAVVALAALYGLVRAFNGLIVCSARPFRFKR